MVAGRKPKPDALKTLTGNPGKRAAAMNTPQPDPAGKRSPHGLSAGGRSFWRKLAGELIELGVLTIVDVPAFILMAEHYSMARRVMEKLVDGDLTVTDKNGAERKHPLLQVFKDNAAAYRMFAAEFGMTPSSRSRLHVPAVGPEQLSLAEELFALVGEAAVIDEGADGD